MDYSLPTIKWMQMIDKRKFTAAALALDKKVFVMHVAYLRAKLRIYPARKLQIVLLLDEKVGIL